jgi:hypothetical protein
LLEEGFRSGFLRHLELQLTRTVLQFNHREKVFIIVRKPVDEAS